MGRTIGARELKATTVTPASRGPPRCRYLSLLKKDQKLSALKPGGTYVAVAPT